MIKGMRNQLGNVGNRFQGQTKKVLCTCSAGLLRSPTMANVLHKNYGFNTRAVGADKEFALIPITQALIWWADEIVFVNHEAFCILEEEEKQEIEDVGVNVVILDIEDSFDYMDTELCEMIARQYDKHQQKAL
tara:strand:+ start:75433 stop:75831 length:399 start_codon:yes stop_codon:yes gene_type:complete